MAEGIDRRMFLGMTGAMGIAGAMGTLASTAYATQADAQAQGAAEVPAEGATEGAADADAQAAAAQTTLANTPADVAAKGGSYLSLAQVNDLRHQLVDSIGDYTMADGTVVPAVWNKLRTLIYSIGLGCGDAPATDDSFAFFQRLFTEDEAQAYIEMPYGVLFTAADFAESSGRDEQACLDLCEDLANRGLLWRARRAGVAYFHQVAVIHGIFEYNWPSYYGEDGWVEDLMNSYMYPMYASGGMLMGGTPFYYAIPCDESIVGDEQILVGDDYRKIVERNEYIAVAPCQCRTLFMKLNGAEQPPASGTEELKEFHTPVCGHPLETCLLFGEEAQYYLERGIARQVDQDEALSILQRSVDEGMILQSCFTRGSEIICSCHGDCCGILKGYLAAGADVCAVANSYPNNSHYNLVYDQEACIQCGACVARCPMGAISMDETNHPVVNATCMRCGQCGMVCPAHARTLTAKDRSEYLELPADLLDDYNLNAEFRFDHGMVH